MTFLIIEYLISYSQKAYFLLHTFPMKVAYINKVSHIFKTAISFLKIVPAESKHGVMLENSEINIFFPA